MTFLDAIMETRATKWGSSPPRDPVIAEWLGGRETISGAQITPQIALSVSPWYACVRILSETIASLPIITYRRLDRGRERASDHPVYSLLHDAPNPFMTANEFIESRQGHLLGWGNAFAEIERNGAGQVIALWPIPPDHVRLQIMNNPDRLWYWIRPPDGGTEVPLRQDQVLHIRGLSGDGIIGYGIVDLLRESLGLTKVEEEYRARFFKNDARPGGIVEYPGVMNPETLKQYKKDWNETYGGIGNKFRLAFLEQGLKYHDTAFTPEAAQFIEGRKFQKEDMAMITGVPLILLQGTEKATSWGTGIEQFLLAFASFTIRPWLKRWESRLNYSLFTAPERKSFYVEALIDDLLRADSMTRANVLQVWRRNGIINANQWLEMENRNPIPGEAGEIYTIEGNMTRLDQVGMKEDTPDPKLSDAV